MNQFALNYMLDHDGTCAELLSLAQRELAALFQAVTQLFGAEEAELSAEDWLRELEASPTLPVSAREWRRVTTKVITQLAERCIQATALPVSAELEPTNC